MILDSNAVGIYQPLGGNAQRLLLAAAAEDRLVLVVPELVVREVVNKWHEKARAELEKAHKPLRELGRYGIDVTVPSEDDLARQREEIEERLRRTLEAKGVEVAPFPRLPHEAVAERALGRRQPFDARGKDGYRDSLLWETVLTYADANDEVILVSNDHKAFAANREEGRLSDDLAAEFLERAGGGALELVADPAALAERLAAQDEETLDAVRTLVVLRSFRIILDEELNNALFAFDLDARERARLELDIPVLDAWVREHVELGQINVRRAYVLGTGEALVGLTISALVQVAFRARGAEALSLSRRDDVWLDADAEWRDVSPRDEWVGLVTARVGRISADVAIELPGGRIERLVVSDIRIERPGAELAAAHVVDDEPLMSAADEQGY